MVALVQQYGAERIIINSAADWGVSDPLKVPKTVAVMREPGIAEATIETIVWRNPIAFFAQSGRLDSSERATGSRSISASSSRATRCCAARRPWSGAERVRHAPHRRPERRRAHAGAARRRTRRTSALRARGALRPLATVLPAVTCTRAVDVHDRHAAARARHRRATAGTSATSPRSGSGGSRTTWSRARRSGTPPSRRDPRFTCAKLFWWYNMYSSADFAVTPRPLYPADGRKLPDVYTRRRPSCATSCKRSSGTFPLFSFWGPRRGHRRRRSGSRECARHVYDTRRPTLTLVYLPHLDYDLQRFGPERPDVPRSDLREIDAVCGELIEHVRARRRARDRAVRVRHHPGARRGPREPRAARSGPARGARRARAGAARCRRLGGVRGRRSPDRARLRAAPRARRRGATLLAEPRGRRARARRGRQARAPGSTTRARASSSRSRPPIAGSPTTTGSTTRARPTSRAPSTSTASPATTRSSCSSIPRSGCPQLKIGWTLAQEGARLPLPDGRDPARHDARARLARPADRRSPGRARCS